MVKLIRINEKLHEELMMEKIQRKAKSIQELLQIKLHEKERVSPPTH